VKLPIGFLAHFIVIPLVGEGIRAPGDDRRDASIGSGGR
jgi:hypothetical protein